MVAWREWFPKYDRYFMFFVVVPVVRDLVDPGPLTFVAGLIVFRFIECHSGSLSNMPVGARYYCAMQTWQFWLVAPDQIQCPRFRNSLSSASV